MGKRGPRPQVRYWNRQGGGYFATIGTRKVALALGPDDAPGGPCYLAALDAFRARMVSDAGKGTNRLALSDLVATYLDTLIKAGKAKTADRIRAALASFLPRVAGLACGDLRGFHVREWLDAQGTWGPTTRKIGVNALRAALNFGVRDGLIETNPLAGRVKTPQDRPRGREFRLAPGLADLLIAAAHPAFADVLRFLRATGCRPEEVEQITAAHVRLDRVVFRWQGPGYIHKQAQRGKQVDRVIFLTPGLQELVSRLAAKSPRGPIFRTGMQTIWNAPNRGERWRALLAREPVAGFLASQGIDPRHVIPYSFRHTWISEWIDSGRSAALAAALVGTSVSMIERHYGHPDSENLRAVFLGFAQQAGESEPEVS